RRKNRCTATECTDGRHDYSARRIEVRGEPMQEKLLTLVYRSRSQDEVAELNRWNQSSSRMLSLARRLPAEVASIRPAPGLHLVCDEDGESSCRFLWFPIVGCHHSDGFILPLDLPPKDRCSRGIEGFDRRKHAIPSDFAPQFPAIETSPRRSLVPAGKARL